jgi:hypothetical protein
MDNQKPITLDDLTRVISENNNILVPMMGKMMDEKIKQNNEILIPLIDKKIKDNNEYIFENFNDQTDRILNLFKGVMRVNKDGNLGIYF